MFKQLLCMLPSSYELLENIDSKIQTNDYLVYNTSNDVCSEKKKSGGAVRDPILAMENKGLSVQKTFE